MYAYREERPGPRWLALYNATWAAYRQWYTHQGLAARPSLAECRVALRRHMPELLPIWERLSELTKEDPLAARMLAMWRLPAFAVGCAQTVLPGERPVLVRNYDYDQALFEGVIASTNYSGQRRVIGTSDMLSGPPRWHERGRSRGLADFGGRPGRGGEGFGIPLVLRYLLETCGTVREAVAALRRIPVALWSMLRSPTLTAPCNRLRGPRRTAKVSGSRRPPTAASTPSSTRRGLLASTVSDAGGAPDTPRGRRRGRHHGGKLTAPLRSLEFDAGFGTLYTARTSGSGYRHWHSPGAS